MGSCLWVKREATSGSTGMYSRLTKIPVNSGGLSTAVDRLLDMSSLLFAQVPSGQADEHILQAGLAGTAALSARIAAR